MAVERQTATLPPAQPSYILRGHVAQIHSVRFVRQNTRLLTGDADGWVVYWKVETKRALAVWKAHDGAILETSGWGRDKIITHGRDNNLRIWQVRPGDESSLSTTLPAEQASVDQSKPWLLHTLPVNTLNFCAFSMCHQYAPEQTQQVTGKPKIEHTTSPAQHRGSILIAVPARDDKKVEVYQFPEERLRVIVPRAQSTDTGMVMAVKLVHQSTTNTMLVLVGYEGGLTAAFKLPQITDAPIVDVAQLIYLSQPHTQPILSLDISLDGRTYYTSSADAIIAAHGIPDLQSDESRVDTTTTTDNSVAPTTSPTVAVPSVQNDCTDSTQTTTPPPPIPQTPLQSAPQEPINFSKKLLPHATPNSRPTSGGLSSLLSSAPPLSQPIATPRPPNPITIQPPYKTTDTKHSGQQSLRVRSDGRLLVTGGWDSRIRVYSSKTLKEVAVLKWHKEGVYAVGFSEILEVEDLRRDEGSDVEEDGAVVKRETGLSRLQRQREEAMQMKHWVVAGAKDGKVSLWEVF